MPAISVVMSTYNTSLAILTEAVDSILGQTFSDFEFIIIDDGSTDETPAYLDSLTDPRVRIIRNNTNIGLTKSLNIGFRMAQGKYIARMDSDDISMPDRLEKQYAFMEEHLDVIVCGTRVTHNLSKRFSSAAKPVDMESYRIRMLFANPGPYHPTAFFRREELIRHHIEYDENLKYAQDYGMWMVCSQYGKICTIQESLLFYRLHDGQVSKSHREEQIKCDKMTQKKLLYQLLDNVTEEEQDIHYRYSTGYYHDVKMTGEIKRWYLKLIRANNKRRIYDRKKFNASVYDIIYRNIKQTFDTDMGVLEKTILLFRYMPLKAALKKLPQIGMKKIKEKMVNLCA